MLNIAILGCGYVGLALATYLSKKKHHVSCSTRSHSKLKALKSVCQKTQIVHSDNKAAVQEFLQDQNIVIVSIAPDNVEDYENTYLNTAHIIKTIAMEAPEPKTLIYLSSTSIYGDHNGQWVDEESKLLNNSKQSKILIETENTYRSLEKLGWNIVIFRLSEIYGPNRELSKKVKKYQGVIFPGSGQTFTNMVHLDDIVSAIDYSINHSLSGTYNLSDDDHLSREELYNQVSEKLNLKKITFDSKKMTSNKRVSNHTIKSVGYSFVYPHRKIS